MKEKNVKLNAFLNAVRRSVSIVSQVITLQYVTRVLTAENYGKVSFCNSIVSYFILIAGLGVTNYAIREGAGQRDDRPKLEEFSAQVFTINILSTAASYLLFLAFILLWNGSNDNRLLLLIFSAGILLTTLGVEWLYIVFEDYLYITIRSVVIHVIGIVLIFTFVKTPEDYIKYALIMLTSSQLGNILNFFYSRKYLRVRLTKTPNFSKHLRPIMVLFANAALITVYLNSDITMLGVFRTEAEVGVYQVAVNIYVAVKEVLNAVVLVTLPRFSYYLQNRDMQSYSELSGKTFGILLTLMVPAVVGLFMVSPDIIWILSGKEYMSGVGPLRILCVSMLFATLACFFVHTCLLPDRQDRKVLLATFSSALLNIVLNLFLIPWIGINGAAVTTLLAELLVTVIAVKNSTMPFSMESGRKVLRPVLLGSVCVVLVCVAVSWLNFSEIPDLAAKVIASAAVYSVVQIAFKNNALFKKG